MRAAVAAGGTEAMEAAPAEGAGIGEGDCRGEVTVWRGGSGGPGSSAVLTQATTGVAGVRESEDWFGASVSAGDVNGDGYPDLAVGAYGEKIGDQEYAGIVHVLWGGANGLTGRNSQAFSRATDGVPGHVEFGDSFGSEVRLRADRDDYDDLYIDGDMATAVRLPGSSRGITVEGVTKLDDTFVDGILQ